jgi:hypothetical protein
MEANKFCIILTKEYVKKIIRLGERNHHTRRREEYMHLDLSSFILNALIRCESKSNSVLLY